MRFSLKNMVGERIFERLDLKDSRYLKVLVGLILLVLITFMFPQSESVEFTNNIGSVWTNNDLIALFSFPIYKEQRQYEKEKLSTLATVYPVFERRQEVERAQLESLNVVIENLRHVADVHEKFLKTQERKDSLLVAEILRRYSFGISNSQWKLLTRWKTEEGKKSRGQLYELEQKLNSLLSDMFRAGIIDSEAAKQSQRKLAIRTGTLEEIVDREKVMDINDALMKIQGHISASTNDADAIALSMNIVGTVLQPNVIYNAHETQLSKQSAEESVPRTIGFVQENERIVNKHDRITDEVKLKLDSYRRAKAERGSVYDVWWQRAGFFCHVALIVSLFSIYLYLFRKRIFNNNAMLTLIAFLLLMETFFAYLSLSLNVSEPIQYLIFIPAASMLLTIIFDSRVAFYGTVTMAFLVAGIRGNDYAIALSSLIAGALGAYTVRDIRNRTQIFRSLGFIFLGYAVSIVALAFERFDSVNTVVTELTFALANAVFSPVLTYGLLIFFERVFKVTTDLTLLELSDFNHPLLRQLSEKAPGTFHHSMTLGSLAEAAAEAVGANSILARVGAYYHDIGKALKPEYFVENQTGTKNRHAKLKPRMSALVIISHVKEGIELAREHGLPEKVVDFIPQHHGTNRISFFFDKALKQAAMRKNPKDTVRDEDYRYPGPKPQSKEAAIVMLADLVEAATRTLAEVTPQKLEQVVENMIKQRFIEGQLDECELTLKDLTRIKETFLKILVGIHHQRIEYPEQAHLSSQSVDKPVVDTVQQEPSVPPALEVSNVVDVPVYREEVKQPEPAIVEKDSVPQTEEQKNLTNETEPVQQPIQSAEQSS